RFSSDTTTISPVARHVLATVLPLPPQSKCHPVSISLRKYHAGFTPNQRARPSNLIFRGYRWVHFSLRPRDSLTAPRVALSVSLFHFVSSMNATSARGPCLLLRWECSHRKCQLSLDTMFSH